MMAQIVKTTDSRHIGVNIKVIPEVGDDLLLGDFVFEVQAKVLLDNSNVLLSNPNYQIEIGA
jgi:hypothetical protein